MKKNDKIMRLVWTMFAIACVIVLSSIIMRGNRASRGYYRFNRLMHELHQQRPCRDTLAPTAADSLQLQNVDTSKCA